MLKVHRKEQWDLDCYPIICIHNKTANQGKRVFCVWLWGIQVGVFMLTRKCIKWGNKIYRFN